MTRIADVFCLLLVVVAAAKKEKPSAIAGRIVGGNDTDIKDVPYQVSLQKNGEHECGGSIIRPKFILTAAHCVYWGNESNYTIRAGSKHHAEGGVIRNVKKITRHSKYSLISLDNDIALLKLDKRLNFTENIQKIPLATKEPKKGDEVLVSGWGALKENGTYASTLHSVTVKVIDRESCKIINPFYAAVTDNMFCAGYMEGGKDACTGDSGGPAAVKGRLAGIVSGGRGCARPKSPGVYTNVAKYREWIQNTIRSKN